MLTLDKYSILLLNFVAGKCTNSRIQVLHASSRSQHCMVALYTNNEYQLNLFSTLLHLKLMDKLVGM